MPVKEALRHSTDEKQSPTYRLLEFIHRHSLAFIIACTLVTAGFGVALLHIKIDPDLESLVSDDEEVTRLMKKHGRAAAEQNYFVFAAEAADPFSLEGLSALSRAIERLEELPEIKPGITPFNLFAFRKAGTRLAIEPLAAGGAAPSNPEELERFKERILHTPPAENLVISGDGTTLVSFFPAEKTDNYTRVMNEVEKILSTLDPYYRTYTTGTIPFMKTTESYLSRDMSRLLVLACAAILVTFYLGFSAKRAIFLPLLIVLMGTIWCLGFMSLAGFPLSIMSVVIPPLVLSLGGSYSIHILNQYYRESWAADSGNRWITGSIVHVNRTVLLASVTTVAGLLSLLAVSMRQTREFALSTSFGILACAVLSLFFFPAVLYRLKPPGQKQSRQVLAGPLTRTIGRLSALALRWRFIVIALLGIVAVLFVFSVRKIQYNTDAMSYFPDDAGVVRDMRFFTEKIGGFEEISISLTAPNNEKGYFLDTEVLEKVSRFESGLEELPDICYISSFVQYLKYMNQVMYGSYVVPESRGPVLLLSRYFKLIGSGPDGNSPIGTFANDDFSTITITMRIYDASRGTFIDETGLKELLGRIDTIQTREIPAEITIERWGPILRYLALSNIFQRDSIRSMLIAMLAILCITTVAFRSVAFGLYSLVPMATGVMLNVVFMVAARIPLDMITIIVSSIAIGVGVDDSIHFLIQFRKNLAKDEGDIFAVLRNTLAVTGRPIVLTSVSIIGGLLILGFATFKPIMYFGLLIAFTLAATCLGTIAVLPAVISIGRKGKTVKKVRR